MSDNADLVRVGIIIKPHGIHGELKVKPLTDSPNRFHSLSEIFMIPVDGDNSFSAKIESVRLHQNRVLIKLDCINSVNEAETVIGYEICINREECIELPSDTYFAFDLIGLKVLSPVGEYVGTIADVLSSPGQDLLVVKKKNNKKVMIPFVAEIVTDISIDQKRIKIQDLPGLLDLETGQ